jgi:methionyl-tRNA formyltransferase
MRIIFAGTPDFSLPCLQALHDSQHEVVAVFTQPDRPAGRGKKLTASPVKQFAEANQLALHQPASLKQPEVVNLISELNADAMVVVAYGLLIPKSILTLPRLGCLNIHPSLLPKWRGASPIQSSLLHGDRVTGVTIMLLDEGMDTGPIITQEQYPIPPNTNSGTLHHTLAELGANNLIKALSMLDDNTATITPQDHSLATHSSKIIKSQAEINWSSSTKLIHQQIMAYNPWPISFTHLGDQVLRIWNAQCLNTASTLTPGSVIDFSKEGITISTGTQDLLLTAIQLPGKKPLQANNFHNAYKDRFIPGKTILS